MALNIITAIFCNNKKSAWTDEQWQWDYGQILKFEGLDLPDAYEVHFSNIAIGGESITQIGGENGVTIPDQFFTTGKTIYAWVYLHQGEDDGETEYSVTIPIKKRPQPSDTPPTPQEQSAIDQAIAALNVAVEKSETAITHYPHIQDGTWWIWDVTTKRWVDTQVEAQGEPGVPGQPGQPGEPGEDGFSPTITVTDITGGHRVTITDAEGTQTFEVLNGTKGDPGQPGTPGDDGYSPTVTVTEITDGHRVVITDKNGSHTFDVMDGSDATVTVDDELDDQSENPVQNKVIDAEIGDLKAEINQLDVDVNGQVVTIPVSVKIGLNHKETETAYISANYYKTWYFPVAAGKTYTIVCNKYSTQATSMNCRVCFGESEPAAGVASDFIYRIVLSGYTYTYIYYAETDGYIGIAHYYDNGEPGIESVIVTNTEVGISQRVETLEEKQNNSVISENGTWEVGSIYSDSGIDYNDNKHAIRTPSGEKIYIDYNATFVCNNELIATAYALKYDYGTGTYIGRIGVSGVKNIKLESGYNYRFILIAKDTSVIITAQTIPNYSECSSTISNNVGDILRNEAEKTDGITTARSHIYEVGSIYGDGTNYNSNTHAIRTPFNSKILIDYDATFVCDNELIVTAYAFKHDASGTFIARIGTTGVKNVELEAGYYYRFVLIAKDSSVVITSSTLPNYSKYSAIVSGYAGQITGNALNIADRNHSVGTDYILTPCFEKKRIALQQLGDLSKEQAFFIYNGKYYSTYGSSICVQDSNFTLENEYTIALGHGNTLQLGNANTYAYAFGWDDNKIYVVNLSNMQAETPITLPTTGYTSGVVDDVNQIAYIFQRNTSPSTEEYYNFIAYDYDNEEVLYTKRTTVKMAAMQACDFIDGKIFVLNGGGTVEKPNGYRVFDTNCNILYEYIIGSMASQEPEGVFVDRTTKDVYVSYISGYVYKVSLYQ